MRKMPTIFKRDPSDMKYVTEEPNPECNWVFAGEGVATRKYDGTCVMLDEDGCWWARREVKPGRTPPSSYLAIETDPATGKTVGWEPIEQSAFAKFHSEALGNPYERRHEGTYELVGPKVNGNPEGLNGHELVCHDDAEVVITVGREYEDIRELVLGLPWEGLVFHHPDGRMAKIKARDFRRG